jgi:hypothetical protein
VIEDARVNRGGEPAAVAGEMMAPEPGTIDEIALEEKREVIPREA